MEEPIFRIPDAFLQKLYELSGAADKYKGFALFCFDSDGNFTPVLARNDPVVSIALQKKIEEWCDKMNEGSLMRSEEEEE